MYHLVCVDPACQCLSDPKCSATFLVPLGSCGPALSMQVSHVQVLKETKSKAAAPAPTEHEGGPSLLSLRTCTHQVIGKGVCRGVALLGAAMILPPLLSLGAWTLKVGGVAACAAGGGGVEADCLLGA